jgi:hypothetical protein
LKDTHLLKEMNSMRLELIEEKKKVRDLQKEKAQLEIL